jgi:hypothetical protein
MIYKSRVYTYYWYGMSIPGTTTARYPFTPPASSPVQLLHAGDSVALIHDLRVVCFDETRIKVSPQDGRLVTALSRRQLEANGLRGGFTGESWPPAQANLVSTAVCLSAGCHFFEVEIRDYGEDVPRYRDEGIPDTANGEACMDACTCPQIFIGVCAAETPAGPCDMQRDTQGCWFMCANFGDRYGSREGLHGVLEDLGEDAAGGCQEGARVGVLVNFDDGSVTFYKNRVRHGMGYPPGSVTGPVMHAVVLGQGAAVMLLPYEGSRGGEPRVHFRVPL